MTIKIGPIELAHPVILAPMSGVTDAPFRTLVSEFGVGMVVCEMVAGKSSTRHTRKSLERTKRSSGDHPFVVQLAGCDPDLMADAARYNVDLGADIIDINMGCPVKKVVNGIGGSALMRDETTAAKIIAATVAATSVPVTLKMRTGWDFNSRNAPRLAKIAQDLGVQMVTVHGRTRQQFYNGRADWDFIAEVKDGVDIPVIANGDIHCVEDAANILRRSNADGVMIGRGSCGRPWFPSQVIAYLQAVTRSAEPTLEQQRDTLLRHYRGLLNCYGDQRGMRIARKHIGWYMVAAGFSKSQYQPLQRLNDAGDVMGRISDLYRRQEDALVAA